MKRFFVLMLGMLVCTSNYTPAATKGNPDGKGKILIACFSHSGTTLNIARHIAELTGGDMFRIETRTPYPSDYTRCTEVARKEMEEGKRPDLKNIASRMDAYDIVFVGCPVWWHTAPMAVWSFLESDAYDFAGKTIVPFCTYGATYRDETLAKIVELTPRSKHLQGFGSTGSTAGIEKWLREIGIIE